MIYPWDIIRFIIMILFGLTVGQTGWIVKQYFSILKSTRRLLPYHVFLISSALVGLEAEAVWQNAIRIGEGATGYVIVNLVLFSLALTSLYMMSKHLHRKQDVTKEIVSLIVDSNEMP